MPGIFTRINRIRKERIQRKLINIIYIYYNNYILKNKLKLIRNS